MPEVSERRRKPRHQPGNESQPTWVILQNIPGAASDLRAKVLDSNELGLGIELDCQLEPTTLLTVEGNIGVDGVMATTQARVLNCKAHRGVYRAGLQFEDAYANQNGSSSGFSAGATSSDPIPDYYEVLQISPNADPDMIHRVYRLLAQRYHPDNADSGDEKMFRSITDAYKVLSEPEKRAAYDVKLHAHRQVRWRIFDQRQAAIGKVAERSKRKGILELLYTKRCNEPDKPSMNLHELEDLLGCPREHLEFSIWYLKEAGMIARQDNGRISVTAKGVDWAEHEEAADKVRTDRLIEAAHGSHSAR